MYDYLMNIEEKLKNLTLKQKLYQMFIAGFDGNSYNAPERLKLLLLNGLGGVIFFTPNIASKLQFKQLISDIKDNSLIPSFLSIDQEGGRVERTENIHNGKKYLSAKDAADKGCEFVVEQTELISKELNSYGINMNFAPVYDVNTNQNNPVIGNRAYSSSAEKVCGLANLAANIYMKNKIIPVAKHFPGHGGAGKDSHICLPEINVSLEELENIHIKPFVDALKNKIPAVMIAHVFYPSLQTEKIPASLSEEIINGYLINKLNFQGVVISDDMVMGALNGYSHEEACIKAINAGMNMFIFRDNKKLKHLVDVLYNAVTLGEIDIKLIDKSVFKILSLKADYLY